MEDRLLVTTSQRPASLRYRWFRLTLAGTLALLWLAPPHVSAQNYPSTSFDAVPHSSSAVWNSTELVSWDQWPVSGGANWLTAGDARLVSHSESLGNIRFAANLQPPPPDSIQGAEGQAESIQDAEQLGEEPEQEPLQFLRQVTPLLAPGQWQFDVGVQYLFAETLFPSIVGAPALLTETRVRQRLLTVPLELRYGLTQRAQLFVNAPVGWSNTELAYIDFDESTSTGGIADVTAGVTYLLRQGSNSRPDIIGTIATTAPTGNAGSLITSSLFNPQSQLGQGFWAVSGNLLVVHTCDPLVIFYGLGARFRFSRDFSDLTDVFPGDQYNVNPGEEYSYQLGIGFAVTPRITLSTVLLGGYVVEDRINGDRLELGNLEPIRMRFATTIARPCNIVEPYANIGMTDDAPDAILGVTWTY
jgi:hypothetical protein